MNLLIYIEGLWQKKINYLTLSSTEVVKFLGAYVNNIWMEISKLAKKCSISNIFICYQINVEHI